jgi:hypothetical protein
MTATEAKWTERVREWKASGKALHEFAAGQSYKASSLGWWAWQLRKRASKGGAAGKGIRLAQVVRRAPPQKESSPMVLEVAGTRIAIQHGFDAELLGRVVRTLREGL